MNREFRDRWVAALRSGQYQQGKGKLRTAKNAFCCLGVACDISSKLGRGEWEKQDGHYTYNYLSSTPWDAVLPPALRQAIGLELEAQDTLADMNDGKASAKIRGASFEEIADWIEANL